MLDKSRKRLWALCSACSVEYEKWIGGSATKMGLHLDISFWRKVSVVPFVCAFQHGIVLSSEPDIMCLSSGGLCNWLDWGSVPLEGVSHLSTYLCIPKLNCPIKRAGHNVPSIWWECNWVDCVSVSSEGVSHLATCLCIPKLNCFIIWTRYNMPSIWWEGNWQDKGGVPLEGFPPSHLSVHPKVELCYHLNLTQCTSGENATDQTESVFC